MSCVHTCTHLLYRYSREGTHTALKKYVLEQNMMRCEEEMEERERDQRDEGHTEGPKVSNYILLFYIVLCIKLDVHTTFDCFYICGCLFHLFWNSFCGCCFPQFLALSPMSSFFPMVYLALTTAILHRVA